MFCQTEYKHKHTSKCVNPLLRSFTLIELLVVVAIIAVLVAVLLPALQSAREQANRVMCSSQLRGMNQAFYAYAGDFDGWFPMGNWWSARYISVDFAPYLGGGPNDLRNCDFWKHWLKCPGRRTSMDSWVHFWSRGMVQGEYHYFGGHGNFGLANSHGGSYPETGWLSGYFLNSHKPSPKVDYPFVLEDPSRRVLMCDMANYEIAGSGAVPYIESNVYIYINHGVGKLKPDGENLLYVDGHVRWEPDPWGLDIFGQCRFAGGRGRLAWSE